VGLKTPVSCQANLKCRVINDNDFWHYVILAVTGNHGCHIIRTTLRQETMTTLQ